MNYSHRRYFCAVIKYAIQLIKKIGLKCYVIEKIYGSYSNTVPVWGQSHRMLDLGANEQCLRKTNKEFLLIWISNRGLEKN